MVQEEGRQFHLRERDQDINLERCSHSKTAEDPRSPWWTTRSWAWSFAISSQLLLWSFYLWVCKTLEWLCSPPSPSKSGLLAKYNPQGFPQRAYSGALSLSLLKTDVLIFQDWRLVAEPQSVFLWSSFILALYSLLDWLLQRTDIPEHPLSPLVLGQESSLSMH